MKFFSIFFHFACAYIACFALACDAEHKTGEDVLGEFGAFYSRIDSDQEFERFSRTREHPDIIVDLGKEAMTFNFWRGSSYLPYLESPEGRWYVKEIFERKGDGDALMPDKTNAFSHAKIISASDREVVIHWRYLPQFEGGNPKKGASPDKFVDEYFHIKSSGDVKRLVKQGTARIDDWENSSHMTIHTFKLERSGIKTIDLKDSTNVVQTGTIEGNPVINPKFSPAAWWSFDEGQSDFVQEQVGQATSEVKGNKTLWRKGVSGSALQFDGYKSEITLASAKAPGLSGALTLEGWVALGAYPWNEVPLIQQMKDSTEIGSGQQDQGNGYFLGIDGYGKPLFKLGNEEIKSEERLDRRTWYHLAATYDAASGEMALYMNGKPAARKVVAGKGFGSTEADVRIGKGNVQRPILPVRKSTFPAFFSLDGLIDEVKIYNKSMDEKQIAELYKLYAPNAEDYATVDMDLRVLPEGENRKRFGAYYTHLKYYDVYDNFWRFGEHPDVVVEFDDNPAKFIFWRGVGYIPMMVNDMGQWYSNEFNETWGKSGGQGCQEPMSDKESYYNHVRILENTPARVVVHWRYPLIDVNYVLANFDEDTGWGDWSDWYYYIYPDGVAVKSMKLWTDGDRNHEWQESMVILGPDQHPEDIIHKNETLTMMNLEGERKTYDWTTKPPDHVNEPKDQCIQHINYTGYYKPVTIGNFYKSDVYNGEVTDYSVFPTWNHWPVAQIPSDGRYAFCPDRTAHSSLTHVHPEIYRDEFGGPTPYYEKILMEAMWDDNFEDLLALARSWLNAPEIANLKGADGGFLPEQRAYVLEKKKDTISFSMQASDDAPLQHLAIVIRKWNSHRPAQLLVNGKPAQIRQGTFRDTDGTRTLSIWYGGSSLSEVQCEVKFH